MGSSFNKSFLIVGSAKLINAALIFLRMAILARLLSPVNFGVAATFWITTGILAAITEIGIDKMLIQDKEGASERFGAVAQTLFFIRGAIIALSILLLAPLLSVFFDIPHAANDFAMLAVLPLLKGLEHRSYIQKQRKMEFIPLATLQISPDLISLILAYPLAVYFQDYRAFIYLSIAAGLISLLVSHLVAENKINYCWDRDLIIRILKFGWPLTISSVLLMLTLQGDKLIISQYYSKYELGLYSVAFAFATFMPNNLGGVLVQIVLPYLSKIRDDAGRLLLRIKYLNQFRRKILPWWPLRERGVPGSWVPMSAEAVMLF